LLAPPAKRVVKTLRFSGIRVRETCLLLFLLRARRAKEV
jgi:hypothetical protein